MPENMMLVTGAKSLNMIVAAALVISRSRVNTTLRSFFARLRKALEGLNFYWLPPSPAGLDGRPAATFKQGNGRGALAR